MLLLPTFNARLQPCPVSAAAFMPHEKGQFCSQCQRVVQDFSRSLDPVADLAAARAAAPDGRVCGSFAAAQVQRPKLPQRLRWFVVALVLVLAQGLSAREALAQVRNSTSRTHTTAPPRKPVKKPAAPEALPPEILDPPTILGGVTSEEHKEMPLVQPLSSGVYTYVEQMPEAPDGSGMAGLGKYLLKNIHPSPADLSKIIGRIFVKFVVTETGAVSDAFIVKGCGCGVDTAVLEAARNLTGLRPGRQNGQPVKVEIVLPVLIETR